MGRYSLPLAVKFLDLLDPQRGQRALDVGCGTGHRDRRARRAASVRRRWPRSIRRRRSSAPSGCGCRTSTSATGTPRRCRSTTTRSTSRWRSCRSTSWPTRRVAWPRWRAWSARVALVAAVVWDVHGGGSPLAVFWRAAHAFDPNAMAASPLPGPEDADLTTDLRAGRPRNRRSSPRSPSTGGSTASRSGGSPTCSGRPGRRLRHGAGRRHPRPAGRTVPQPAPGATVRRPREGLGRPRPSSDAPADIASDRFASMTGPQARPVLHRAPLPRPRRRRADPRARARRRATPTSGSSGSATRTSACATARCRAPATPRTSASRSG